MKRVFLFLFVLVAFAPMQIFADVKEKKDTATVLSEIAVVAKVKQKNDLRVEPLSATVVKLGEIERKQVVSLSDLSFQTPNLYIPSYGSKMTSSIYVRGLGSRIDNPAIGMYIDNVPYMNKNGFDVDMWDIMRMEVLRGPQSTLYGRNTVGGIINIYTLSPKVYEGFRFSGTYSSGNSYNVKGSYYEKLSDKVAFS
ncbi:MAG: Plug domain-containing protein, partial [Bacteroidia bacterium]|nr:Plug domain-containing protein [Bacteroidia bacterium]